MAIDFKKKLADQRAKEALDKQLQKIKGDGAPSMNPWVKHKKKEEEPPPPALSTFTKIPSIIRARIAKAVEQHAAFTAEQYDLKAGKKELTDALKEMCNVYSLDKFMVGENRVAYYKTGRATISKTLLLAAGVSPAIIAKCTISKDAWSLKVTGPNVKEEEDDNDT